MPFHIKCSVYLKSFKYFQCPKINTNLIASAFKQSVPKYLSNYFMGVHISFGAYPRGGKMKKLLWKTPDITCTHQQLATWKGHTILLLLKKHIILTCTEFDHMRCLLEELVGGMCAVKKGPPPPLSYRH